MKTLMKWAIYGVVGSVVVVAVMVLLRNHIIKFALTHGIKATTGLNLSIDRMHVGLLKPSVDIRGLRLRNPRGFHEDLMMDVPQASVEMDMGDLWRRRVHITSLKFHLNTFVIIKNKKGEVNINALKPVKEGTTERAQHERAQRAKARKAGQPVKFQIDYAEITLGKGIYKDYSAGEPPKVNEYALNITREYRNIAEPGFLVSMLVIEVAGRTAIAKLAGVDLSGAELVVKDAFSFGSGVVGDALGKLKGVFSQ